MSAAKDFGVDPSKLSKAVRKKLGKSMLDEAKEKTEYDYEGDMAMSQLKSIIANSQRMHDMLSDDTNLPEWVQSKITLAEDYISTASNYMQGEMSEALKGDQHKIDANKNGKVDAHDFHLLRKKKKVTEEAEELDELSKKTLRDAGGKMLRKGLGDGSRADKHMKSANLASAKLYPDQYKNSPLKAKVNATEEVEQVDEISSDMAHRYLKGKRERDYDISADGKSSKLKKPQSFAKMNKDVKSSMRALRTIEKAKKTNEDVEQVDEVSKAAMGRYIIKAKDSIDMTSYRSGIKDGTAISSSTPYKSNNPLEKKLSKRHKGIETAVKKLTKEDIDAVKSMNESYKTAFNTALIEYNIKSPSELGESKRKEFFNYVDLEFKKGDN
jgi:hypothetical protein